jgi:anti-sigma regulatory factor (Ser/Thr protein kinase)
MPTTRATGQPAPILLPVSAGGARHELQALLTGTRWCRDKDSIVLAVHEAITNAEIHGGGVLRVQVGVEGGDLAVRVCDRGPGFDVAVSRPPAPDVYAEGGRGLCLIRQVASRVEGRRDDGDFCLYLRFEPP